MKKNLLRLIVLSGMLFTMSATVNGQNSFPATGAAGIGTTTPNASSLLDIQSTTKGILIPRMTQVQRNAIATPTAGLLIYQTSNTKGFYYYTGTAWTAVSAKGANTTLANLVAPTAVNQSLLPGTTGAIDLGSATNSWKDIYASGIVKAANLQMTNGAVAGSVLTSDVNGLATWQAPTGGGWGLSGNTGTTIANFMGTNDNRSLRFRTNNTEKMIIDSLGKVGIGTTTPSDKLTVLTGINSNGFVHTDGTRRIGTYVGGTTGGGWFGTFTNHPLCFFTNNSGSQMIIAQSGNVGIGTVAPAATLEVAGEIRASSDNANLNLQRTTGANYVNFNDANDLYFRSISPTNTNANIRMAIDNVGRVGIGVSVLTEDLAVRNIAQATNMSVSTDDNHFLNFYSGSAGDNNSAIITDNGQAMRFGQWSNLQGHAGYVERMRIEANGIVGIGTSSPTSQSKLHVVTNTTGANWAAMFENTSNTAATCHGISVVAGNNAGTNYSNMITFNRPDGAAIGSVGQTGSGSVDYATTSDLRLKNNIQPTKFGLADLNKIEVRDYDYINGSKDRNGFIAQQLYKIYPEAVVVGGEDSKTQPWMVDYGRVTPLLVKSIQDLSAQNDAKDNTIKSLQSTVGNLQNQLNEMQQCVESLCNNATSGHTSTDSYRYRSVGTTENNSSSLFQNQPNPFNQTTVIRYTLSGEATSGKIIIRDLNGNLVKQVSIAQSGKGQVTINANELAQGTYTYTLEIGGESVDTKLMVVTK